MITSDYGLDYYEEDEFKAHPASKPFFAECKRQGVDLTGWRFGECTIDADPKDYGMLGVKSDGKPHRNCSMYYCHPTDEDVSCSADMDDSTGKWEVFDFTISRD